MNELPETAAQSSRTYSIENTFSSQTTNNGSGLFGSGVSGYKQKINFSKVSSIVASHCKCTRALTIEGGKLKKMRQPSVPLRTLPGSRPLCLCAQTRPRTRACQLTRLPSPAHPGERPLWYLHTHTHTHTHTHARAHTHTHTHIRRRAAQSSSSTRQR